MKLSMAMEFRKVFSIFTVMALVATASGVVFLTEMKTAFAFPDPVSAVTLTDSDTTNYGLNGNDFSISWTPGISPAGYSQTMLYVVRATTDPMPTAANITSTGCGGSGCIPLGSFLNFQVSSFQIPPMVTSDSNNLAFDQANQYKAGVLTYATTPVLTWSSAASVASDSVTDTIPPFVNHMSTHTVNTGADAKIYAIVRDEQTTTSAFNNTGDMGNEHLKLCYSTGTLGAGSTCVDGVSVAGVLFGFTISSAAVGAAGGILKYIIKANDSSNNDTFFCNSPDWNVTLNSCYSNPFTASVVAAGSRTIGGTITTADGPDEGTAPDPVASAHVFASGSGVAKVTTNESGVYTLSGLPNNDQFDITVVKSGYCENSMPVIIQTSDLTEKNIHITAGSCMGSVGGGQEKPLVASSYPARNSFGMLLDTNTNPIKIMFNLPLNGNTVNDMNANEGTDNIYLTSDGSTKITGQVAYCNDRTVPGCTSLDTAWSNNTIVFTTQTPLTANKNYTLVITPAVMAANGQTVEGNTPNGNWELRFNTGSGSYDAGIIAANFGNGGQYMPPYVESFVPGMGLNVANNSSFVLKFNEPILSSTITTSNIKLIKLPSTDVSIIVQASNAGGDSILIGPSLTLAEGSYEIRVMGGITGMSGVPMRQNASEIAFNASFNVGALPDSTPPTIFGMIADDAAGVAVNTGTFVFGTSETMAPGTIGISTVQVKRGANTVSAVVEYDPGSNSIYVSPDDVLSPNTTYTFTFTPGIQDLALQALAVAQEFSYTTGSIDTVPPQLREARCDDFTCHVSFPEPMISDSPSGASYAASVLNHSNLTLTQGAGDLIGSAAVITWDPVENAVIIENLSGLTIGGNFVFTAGGTLTDLSGNALVTAGGVNVFNGKVEDSDDTYGNLGGTGGGMFGSPTMGGGDVGGKFVAEGFGGFTGAQVAFGGGNAAYPFNNTAGVDSNVFQTRFSPGVVLQDGDFVVLTFPQGTTITTTAPDIYSPYYTDFNEQFGAGTVAFDTTYDTDGVAVDTTLRTVTVKLDVTGTPTANDPITIDLRKITNPSIPKDPSTGGYTVGIKVMRSGQAIVNKTSMPYFIMQGGSRSITVNVYAGSQVSPTAGANGSLFLYGGGPSGPLDKNITLTNGSISAVEGVGAASVAYTSLQDGCYFVGMEPLVSLGGVDYYGQMSPEPICVNSGTPSVTKNIVLTSAEGAGTSATVTVKLAGIANFSGADIDVFAGGPGRFVVKTLSDVGVPNVNGYTLRLPENGQWFVGVGPSMPKGTAGKPTPLPGVPPPPIGLNVSGVGGTPAVSSGFNTPYNVSFNDATDTVTFTFAAADKTVSGTVTDGSTGLANVDVNLFSQNSGQPAFTTTKSDGTFSLSVSSLGPYELCAFNPGLPNACTPLDIRPDGADAGTDPDIFVKGKQITGGNPLVLVMSKPAWYISGKVLDSSGNGIGYAPVFATDTSGTFVHGGTSSDGSYTLFVANGTWTVNSQLPPDKTDTCGTFSKSVTVNGDNQTNQNISPSTSTCYTLSGTVTIGGTAQANVPVFVGEWNNATDNPADGGLFKPSSTDSTGAFSTKVAGGGKTYRVGTWDPSYGEISTTCTVAAANVTDCNVNSGTTGTITFAFTGGTSTMEAFIEVKKSGDAHTRMSKVHQDLSTNTTMTVKEGTYDYFVNVIGLGSYTGTVATGATATINLGTVSIVSTVVNVDDTVGTNVSGALVTATDSDGDVVAAVTDSSGNATLELKDGEIYTMATSIGGYVPSQATETFTASSSDLTYQFGIAGDQTGLELADNVISGTVTLSGIALTEGGVFAEKVGTGIANTVVSVPIDADGTYELPVTDGTWAVYAVGSGAAQTSIASFAVTGDVSGKTIAMTVDTAAISETAAQDIPADTGGTFDDSDDTGIKLSVASGVLETGSNDVSLVFEKTFTAPDTSSYQPLADAAFSITASSDSSSSVEDLNGYVDLTIDYTSLVAELPSGFTESDLILAYYSPERDEYIPVEGGYTVDAANNTITGMVDHFTDFALVTSQEGAPSTPSGLAAPTASSSQINLSWTQTSGATSYDIYRDTNPSGLFARIGSEPTVASGSTTTYSDTNLTASTTYYYKISSLNGSGESAASTPAVSATTSAAAGGGVILPSGGSSSSKKKAVEEEEEEEAALEDEAAEEAGAEAGAAGEEAVGADAEAGAESGAGTADEPAKEHWAISYIEDLFTKHIITSTTKTTYLYSPNDYMTRASFVEILVGTFGYAVPEDVEEAPFTDVSPNATYAPAIKAATDEGVISGYADGKFKPMNKLTRAEALKFFVDATEVDVEGVAFVSNFPDVGAGDWFAPYVTYAVEMGIIHGYANGTFGPNNYLTRGEIAVIASLFKSTGLVGWLKDLFTRM